MKLYKDDGTWSDELLAACKGAGSHKDKDGNVVKYDLPPNQHPEVLKAMAQPAPYPTTGDQVLDTFSKKERALIANGDGKDKRVKELRARFLEDGGEPFWENT